MPFTESPNRNKEDLTYFFNIIKDGIEKCTDLENNYKVFRSENHFDITQHIIRSLYESDIVIADLSGKQPNPNVMYELGVRLSLTNKPVILIRQECEGSIDPFDIALYHRELYQLNRPTEILGYIIDKINKFECGIENFISPIYSALQASPSVIIHFKKSSAIAILKGVISGLEGTLKNLNLALVKNNSISNIPGKGTFIFRPRQFPGLHAYLTSYPLVELFPVKITDHYDQLLTDFYSKYYCSDFYWQSGHDSSFSNFKKDSALITSAVKIIIDFIPNCESNSIIDELIVKLAQLNCK